MARLVPNEPRPLPRVAALAVVLALVASLAPVAPAQRVQAALPAGFVDEAVITGLNNPTQVEFSPDGRVFVAEKAGVIKVFDSLADTTPTVFANLATNVHNFWDRGLLGLALAPGFPTDPWVYVLYAYDAEIGGTAPRWGDACPNPPGATGDGCVISGRLSRLQASGNVMTGDEQVLINDWCQQYPSHSTGDLAFGPDGALYASGGDGASFNFVDYGQDGSPLNPCGDPPGGVGAALSPPTAEGGALRSQDLRTGGDPVSLDGTIIRVDPATGAGLPGNPLYSSADANARRIVAHGLRNPFRIAFQPGTGELWIGDVGWSRWEEVNRMVDTTPAAPLNYGWPCYEGVPRQGGYDNTNLNICENLYAEGSGSVVAPHFAYRHDLDVAPPDDCPPAIEPTQVSSSIAGLDFYDGTFYPAAYHGALFGADYSRDCIWVMYPDASGVPDTKTVTAFQPSARNPVDLEVGPDGNLYYVDIGGAVRRIRHVPTNQPPTAVISATPTSGAAPLEVQFDGSGSSDPEGQQLSFAWDLDGDGALDDATTAQATHTYTAPGSHTARLRVTDPGGEWDEETVTIQVANTPPTIQMNSPADGTTWIVGDTIGLDASASDNEDGDLTSAIEWSIDLYHCAGPTCHVHPIVADDSSITSFEAPDHEFPSYLEVTAAVTDSSGSTAAVTRRLDPRTVHLSFLTDPAGLELTFAGETAATPFTREVIIGSSNSVSAPTPQLGANGQSWAFESWSDGGAQSHAITAPASDASYTATFIADTAPQAAISATPTRGRAPLTVTFDGRGSSDPDGDPLTYAWAFGDGATAGGAQVSHVYASPGNYTATLTVTDPAGLESTASVAIHVKGGGGKNQAPSVVITQPTAGSTVSGQVPIAASASDDQGVVSVEFRLDGATLHIDTDGTDGWTATWDSAASVDGSHTITAVATDSDGQTASHSIVVTSSGGTSGGGATVHVADLDGHATTSGNTWQAFVTVEIRDADGNAVATATVTGQWSSGASGVATCDTGTDGRCAIASDPIRKKSGSVSFTVVNVAAAGAAYDASANVDPDGDSNGTQIEVDRSATATTAITTQQQLEPGLESARFAT